LHLKKWLELSNIKSGPLFRRFSKSFKLSENRLTDQSVALLLKKYLDVAGIENKNYSGHSLRSGFATVSAESGADERSIMAMTGHKTTQMVRRYIYNRDLILNTFPQISVFFITIFKSILDYIIGHYRGIKKFHVFHLSFSGNLFS